MNRTLWLESVRKSPEQHKINFKAVKARCNARRRLQVRSFILEAKNKPCIDCGKQLDSHLMHFDHRDPKQKLFNIAKSVMSVGWAKLRLEVNKCDVRCTLCHAIRTASQRV